MNAHELAAYHASIRQAAEWALIAAPSLEASNDSVRQTYHVTIEALRGLAEGLRAEGRADDGTVAMVARIASSPATEGKDTCPARVGGIVVREIATLANSTEGRSDRA